MSTPRAIALLVLAALLWSLGGVLVKLVDWHPLAIAGWRSVAAGLAFLLLMRRRPVFTGGAVQLGAAAAYAGTVVSLVVATKLTTAANAILLQYTAPIYVALLAPRLLGEPTRRREWLFIAAALGGMALFFLDRLSPAGFGGNLAGMFSGVCFGLLILLLRRQREGSPFESVLLGNALAAAACLPFMFSGWPGGTGWVGVALLGAVQLALPYYLYASAIRYVPALAAVIITTLEPVLNPVWVAWAVAEVPGPWALAGGVLVLAAVSGRSLLAARRGGGA